MKFLHFSTFYPPYSFGGDAIFLHRLCHALGDAGHQSHVVHCVDAYHLKHPAKPEVEYPAHPAVTTHPLVTGHGRLSPLITHQTGRLGLKHSAVQRILDAESFDVIHYHNASLLGPQCLTLSPRNDQFVKVYTTHEHWLVCPMHVLWKYNRRVCEKPSCLRCVLHGKRPPQWWRYTGMLRKAARHVDQFFSPSRFTAEMHALRGFSQPFELLPYFVPEVPPSGGHRTSPHPRRYFLFVGRLELIKGLQTVIPLWQKVNQDVDLLVAGAGGYETALRELAASNPRIRFLGPLSQARLANLYRHAIASIVPSICYEVFGIVVQESFAAGTPVIARDLGALPEVATAGGGGIIYRSDQELLNAVDQLIRKPELRDELGSNGYRAFQRNWTRDAHLQMYFRHLERIAIKKFGCVPWQDRPGQES